MVENKEKLKLQLQTNNYVSFYESDIFQKK